MPRTPTVIYRNGLTIEQLARQWGRHPSFVRSLIDTGKLQLSDEGLVSVTALHGFMKKHALELD